jgi:hypothetical protein
MPAYSNTTPPLALYPGDVGFSFNNEAFPAGAQAGTQFAVPEPAGLPNQGHTVVWQTVFATAPIALSVSLQGAMADVDAEYATLDTSTNASGEQRTVANVRARFLRLKQNSITLGSGAGFTAKMAV